MRTTNLLNNRQPKHLDAHYASKSVFLPYLKSYQTSWWTKGFSVKSRFNFFFNGILLMGKMKGNWGSAVFGKHVYGAGKPCLVSCLDSLKINIANATEQTMKTTRRTCIKDRAELTLRSVMGHATEILGIAMNSVFTVVNCGSKAYFGPSVVITTTVFHARAFA